MRSKNILSIVAFITAFGLSAAFASLFISQPVYNYSAYTPTSYCKYKRNASSAVAVSISKLIAADHNNGLVRGKDVYDLDETYPPAYNSVTFADYAENVENYVDASSSLNTDGLPDDFRAAWNQHMKAWRDYSEFLNKSSDISKRGQMTSQQFSTSEEPYNFAINSTWLRVLNSGRSYGANVR